MLNQQADATNYYEILEVPQDAPPSEIHRAYHRAKATYSTENPALYSMFSPEEARELLRLIEEAYMILGNPGLRKTYDDSRSRGEPPATALRAAGAQLGPSAASLGTAPSVPMQSRPAAAPATSAAQVAQAAHQALPDFQAPSMPRVELPQTPAPVSKAHLPPGTGRTQLSTYKIDDAFEAELEAANDFDGNLLQRARLYKNISIDRMSEATRISRSYLMAVETNDFKNLPAAVFVRGFVVQMARVLGLPEQKIASSYIKIFKAGGGK